MINTSLREKMTDCIRRKRGSIMAEKNALVIGSISEKTREELLAIPGYAFSFCQDQRTLTDEDLADVDVMVGMIMPDIIRRAPKVSWVQLFSAGADGYTSLPEDILVSNAYGAYGASIAEHMLACTLMAMKRFPEYMEAQKAHRWELLHEVTRIEGANVISVGMGSIGSQYLKRCAALGARCFGVCRTEKEAPDFVEKMATPDTMDELLAEADVVALSLPGTPETKGMFDLAQLRKIKKGAIILNAGRGTAMVTDDLVTLMNEGHFRAACLDVMDPEPLPEDHPLWDTPNVFITPHISGGFRASVNYERVMDVVKENLIRMSEGREVIHAVNRNLGY